MSEDARETAEAALGGEYEITFNGIEVERFAKASTWPTDGPTVLFVGRHEPRKGLAVLLDASSTSRATCACGSPATGRRPTSSRPARPATAASSGSDGSATTRGRGAHAGAPTCSARPRSHGESFGVVLLEAMAAGTAIVASDLPGYRNVATDEVDAVLVPPGDSRALGGAITRVLCDPVLTERLATAGEQRAGGFAMDRLAERYLELYDRVRA